ncbi:hypothetical protein LQZ19_14880 [Treponema primitia]|uniref:hypothetical protein n=1 Tax=Treponema primitia TaxID=88058 RepID=UPI00397F6AC3
MTIEQTIEIPDSRIVQFSPEMQMGRFRIVFFPEPAAPAKATPAEELPRVTRAELEAARLDPIIQELENLPVEPDWSWLPEGLTPETLAAKDIRALRIKEKYGV